MFWFYFVTDTFFCKGIRQNDFHIFAPVTLTFDLLIAGQDDEMFMIRSLNVTPKTTEKRI